MTDQYTLFITDGPWRLGRWRDGELELEALDTGVAAEVDVDASVESRANAACDRLAALGHAGQPLVLAIPSAWCLCATISTSGLEAGNRRQALAYRFEEHLPLSAEDMVADYHEFTDDSALAVGADLETLRAIVDAFDARSVAIGYIAPLALLVAGGMVDRRADTAAVLIESEHQGDDEPAPSLDLVELSANGPARWWWFGDDAEEAARRLAQLRDGDGRAEAIVVGPEVRRAPMLEPPAGVVCEPCEVGVDEAAAVRGARAARDGERLWINLRRDALAMPRQWEVYRRPAIALAAAVAMILLCVIGVTQWRGWQYRAIADRDQQAQVQLFRETLADQAVPAVGVIESRLRSAHRELAGLGGQAIGGNGGGALHERSAVAQLHRLLAALPSDQRLRILDIEIEPDRLRIDGQARSHVEAERIAVALRESGGFEVPPPRTKTLPDRGVSFHLLAKPGAAADTNTKGGRS